MRKIEWVPGTYVATKERASAIAWASHRRGSKVWVGKNVTNAITAYLQGHGYAVEHSRVRASMRKLVDEGYAYILYSDGKKRVKEFGFMPDVDLSGHSLPDGEKARQAGREIGQEALDGVEKAITRALPPIPGAPEPPLYRLDELEKLLKEWAEKDHETYASWIDAAVESLRTNT